MRKSRFSTTVLCAVSMMLGCNRFQAAMEKEAAEAPAPAENKTAAPAEKPPAEEKKSIIGKTTAKVVDAKKTIEDPNVELVDNSKIEGTDPFTQAGSAYVSMASRASTLGMQQAIRLYQAQHDKFPSYDEYMQMMKENRVEFAQLPPYLMYGYNSDTGGIVVLQDTQLKKELHEKAGIPLDE